MQLTELGVSLNYSLIDRRGQAEGRVNLQEEDVHQRRAAKTTREGKQAVGEQKTQSGKTSVFSCLLPPSETRCRGA